MSTVDILTAIGLFITFTLGIINFYPTLKRITSQNKVDDVTAEREALELYREYAEQVKILDAEVKELRPLKAKVEQLENIIKGNLDLVITVPLENVLRDGIAQATVQIKHVKV